MAGVIFSYTWLVPVILWAILSWQGLAVANMLETIAIYGYSLTIYIPICVSYHTPSFALINAPPLIGTMVTTNPMASMGIGSSGCGHVR